MKILLVTNMYPSKEKAYAGIFVKNQYEELQKLIDNDDAIDIYYMKRQFTSKLGSLIKYLKAFLGFIPYLFKKYDVVHLHFFYPLIYLVWIYKKLYPSCKVVVTFHGIDITQKIHDKNKKHFQKISSAIDYTIPVGKTLASIVQEKLHLDIGSILPVGVNNNIFYVEENVEKKYDFIFIGSYIKRKGIDTVIAAIKKLSNRAITFCFCGSGEYGDELELLRKDFNIVIKENQTQNELRHLLNQSKFFLLMSRDEGFPTATIESMYCGIPVITSDISQFKEQVREDINGFIVGVGNSEALSRMINKVHGINDEDYRKLSEGALNSFKELSLQNVCRELYGIYKKLNQSA